MGVVTVAADWVAAPVQAGAVHRALLVAVVAGAVCAVLSCWVTLVGWSLMGDAVSHAVLPGVVLASVAGVPLVVGALVFGAGSVALIGVVNRTSRVKEDAVTGVVFTGMFALGLVLVSAVPGRTDMEDILFGNVLEVSGAGVGQVLVMAAAVAGVVWVKHRDLTLYAFDRVHAHAVGISPRRLEALLLGLLAVTVVVALQVVGVILVVAMVVVPGATAYLLTDRFERMVVIAVAAAVVSAVAGVCVGYRWGVSIGGCVVSVQAVVFLAVYLFSPVHGVAGRWRRRAGAGAAGR